jgi:hypothetical protein
MPKDRWSNLWKELVEQPGDEDPPSSGDGKDNKLRIGKPVKGQQSSADPAKASRSLLKPKSKSAQVEADCLEEGVQPVVKNNSDTADDLVPIKASGGYRRKDSVLADEWAFEPGLSLTATDSVELAPIVVPGLDSEPEPVTQPNASNEVFEEVATRRQTSEEEETATSGKDALASLSEASIKVIAGNPRTAGSVLSKLAMHANPEIRATVARNQNALPETIWLLAKDYDEAVRLAIAEHLESSKDVLRALCDDANPLVSWRANNTLSVLAGSAKTARRSQPIQVAEEEACSDASELAPKSRSKDQSDEQVEFLKLVAQKSNTPARRLIELAKHENSQIRATVAENANTPLEALWSLAKDAVADVKVKLADNYNCPLEIIEMLQQDSDDYVAWRARTILSKLTGQGYHPDEAVDGDPRTSPRMVHSR